MSDDESRTVQSARAFILMGHAAQYLEKIIVRAAPFAAEAGFLRAQLVEWLREEERLHRTVEVIGDDIFPPALLKACGLEDVTNKGARGVQ